MPLAKGDLIGRYEVLAPLGAGGMGEVYRVLDHRLGREVALKVITTALAGDPEQCRRFEQEARAAGRLSHPNVVVTHDAGEHGEQAYLVTELLVGETLRERLRRGPLPAAEVTRLGAQIARGLAAAHSRDILHRDLKPENVFVTSSGVAKILDFGLAKLLRRPEARPDLAGVDAPTVAFDTEQGMLLGTVGYIAPEQARGEAGGPQVDLFALGVVLYELLSGRRAFGGSHPVESLAALLTTEPEPLPDTVPAALARTVARCLAKDPAERFESAHDLAFVLEQLCEGGSSAPALGSTGRRLAGPAGLALATVGALALGLALGLGLSQSAASPPPSTALRISSPADTLLSLAGIPATSPDGRAVAFFAWDGASFGLWTRRLDELEPQRVEGATLASAPSFGAVAWSPDGRSLAFIGDGALSVVPAEGGVARSLVKGVVWGGLDWHGDRILFGSGPRTPIRWVPAAGGEPTVATELGAEDRNHAWPRFLPGGRELVYVALEGEGRRSLRVVSIDGSGDKVLTRDMSRAEVAGPDRLLFVRGDTLLAQRFDPRRLELIGEPTRLVSQVVSYPGTAYAEYSVAGGTLVVGRPPRPSRLAWYGLDGRPQGSVWEPGLDLHPRFARDGRSFVTARSRAPGFAQLWRYQVERGVAESLSRPDIDVEGAVLSPDGTHLAFHASRGKAADVFVKEIGGDSDRALRISPVPTYVCDWSPDGRFVLAGEVSLEHRDRDLLLLSANGEGEPHILAGSPGEERCGTFSPDGSLLALISDETGAPELYLLPLTSEYRAAPGAVRTRVSRSGARSPRWAADGRRLYYLVGDSAVHAARIERRGSEAVVASSEQLFELPLVIEAFDVDPLRERLIVVTASREDTALALDVWTGWQPPAEPTS